MDAVIFALAVFAVFALSGWGYGFYSGRRAVAEGGPGRASG